MANNPSVEPTPLSPSSPDPRLQWQQDQLDETTLTLLDADARYFLHQGASTPCLNALSHCEGIYLVDVQGRRYMDFHGNSAHQVGFSHPLIIQAIKDQLDTLSYCTRRYTNEVAVQLAQKLTELAPGDLKRVLFAPSGTNAVSMALTLTRLATGRHKVVSMWGAFHGASLDAISVSGESSFRRNIGPLLPGVDHVPPPNPYRCQWTCGSTGCNLNCAGYLEYILEKEGDIAAVIAEPVHSPDYFPTSEYWQAVRRACDRYGTLLIFDEIPYALGRTGKMFACEHFGVVPDILLIGKGLGGGVLPLAAMIARETLNIAPTREIGHYTHEKNPVACAAGLATLQVIEQGHLVDNSRVLGAYALEQLRQIMSRHPLIGDVRGLGLLLGVELVYDRQNKTPAHAEAEQVMYTALRRGLSFKISSGNILALTPPLVISREELDCALGILEDSIAEVEGGNR